MRDFLNITKALADGTRLRVLLALRDGELCACQLTELFGLAPSTMSKHFYLLRVAGKDAPTAVREALYWVEKSLARDERITQDAQKLKKVLKCDPAELCRRQCGN